MSIHVIISQQCLNQSTEKNRHLNILRSSVTPDLLMGYFFINNKEHGVSYFSSYETKHYARLITQWPLRYAEVILQEYFSNLIMNWYFKSGFTLTQNRHFFSHTDLIWDAKKSDIFNNHASVHPMWFQHPILKMSNAALWTFPVKLV